MYGFLNHVDKAFLLGYFCVHNSIKMILTSNLTYSDKFLAKAILKVYESQRSFDTAVVIVQKGRNSIYIGKENFKIPRTSTETTLQSRLERLKEGGIIFCYEKQGVGIILKVLVREVRNQKEKKNKFIKQTQFQLF